VRGVSKQDAVHILTQREGSIVKMEKLHNEKLHHLYSSAEYYNDDQIKADERVGACNTHGKGNNSTPNFDMEKWV
jgi:hypothetical protein